MSEQAPKQYTTIPDELRELRQWVVWRYETRHDKPTKVPYKPVASANLRASVTDPQSWGFFGAALAVQELNGYDGIGFVLTKADSYIGIDLDHCVDAHTGEAAAWALDIADKLHSYAEVSPSGTGLRVLCKAKWPGDQSKSGGKRGDIEMYSALRYLTITGKHLPGTPFTIEERDLQVSALYEQVLAERDRQRLENKVKVLASSGTGGANSANQSSAKAEHCKSQTDDEVVSLASRASNSSKFQALWQGDTASYPSASEADAALCSRLAFYTQDSVQIERIFSLSGLNRDKWAKRPDYRERTIALALSGACAHYGDGLDKHIRANGVGPSLASIAKEYSSSLPVPKDGKDGATAKWNSGMPGLVRLSDVQPERVHWLWRGYIALGKLTIVDGDPGLGKSLLTCDLAARVTTNAPMPDGSKSDLQEPAGVLFLSAEDGLADTIRPRLDAAGADSDRIGVLMYVLDEGQGMGAERLPTLADISTLETAIATTGAKLVSIDPLMAHLPDGVNAHRDQDIRRALTPLSKLAESTGVAIVVVRHLNKLGGGNPLYRGGGSIGIIGAARTGLLVAADPGDETGTRRVLAVTKSNLAAPAPALAYRLVTEDDNGVPYVQWEGHTEHTAASLLAGPQDSPELDALTEATEFLCTFLADGPRSSDDVYAEAKKARVSDATLKRAKAKLGIKPRKQGFGEEGKWVWQLPAV